MRESENRNRKTNGMCVRNKNLQHRKKNKESQEGEQLAEITTLQWMKNEHEMITLDERNITFLFFLLSGVSRTSSCRHLLFLLLLMMHIILVLSPSLPFFDLIPLMLIIDVTSE